MNDTSILYEVEMTMPQGMWMRERQWLRQHVAQMLTHQGFTAATLYETELLGAVDEAPQKRVCIHYSVASKQHLEHYFANGAQAMRADGLAHLGDGCVFRRRVLAPMAHDA